MYWLYIIIIVYYSFGFINYLYLEINKKKYLNDTQFESLLSNIDDTQL